MSLKQRLERIENTVNPKSKMVAEWALKTVEGQQAFEKLFNEKLVEYGIGEPSLLLTREEILEAARKIEQEFGTQKAHLQAFLDFERNPENQKMLMEMKRKYGLI